VAASNTINSSGGLPRDATNKLIPKFPHKILNSANETCCKKTSIIDKIAQYIWEKILSQYLNYSHINSNSSCNLSSQQIWPHYVNTETSIKPLDCLLQTYVPVKHILTESNTDMSVSCNFSSYSEIFKTSTTKNESSSNILVKTSTSEMSSFPLSSLNSISETILGTLTTMNTTKSTAEKEVTLNLLNQSSNQNVIATKLPEKKQDVVDQTIYQNRSIVTSMVTIQDLSTQTEDFSGESTYSSTMHIEKTQMVGIKQETTTADTIFTNKAYFEDYRDIYLKPTNNTFQPNRTNYNQKTLTDVPFTDTIYQSLDTEKYSFYDYFTVTNEPNLKQLNVTYNNGDSSQSEFRYVSKANINILSKNYSSVTSFISSTTPIEFWDKNNPELQHEMETDQTRTFSTNRMYDHNPEHTEIAEVIKTDNLTIFSQTDKYLYATQTSRIPDEYTTLYSIIYDFDTISTKKGGYEGIIQTTTKYDTSTKTDVLGQLFVSQLEADYKKFTRTTTYLMEYETTLKVKVETSPMDLIDKTLSTTENTLRIISTFHSDKYASDISDYSGHISEESHTELVTLSDYVTSSGIQDGEEHVTSTNWPEVTEVTLTNETHEPMSVTVTTEPGRTTSSLTENMLITSKESIVSPIVRTSSFNHISNTKVATSSLYSSDTTGNINITFTNQADISASVLATTILIEEITKLHRNSSQDILCNSDIFNICETKLNINETYTAASSIAVKTEVNTSFPNNNNSMPETGTDPGLTTATFFITTVALETKNVVPSASSDVTSTLKAAFSSVFTLKTEADISVTDYIDSTPHTVNVSLDINTKNSTFPYITTDRITTVAVFGTIPTDNTLSLKAIISTDNVSTKSISKTATTKITNPIHYTSIISVDKSTTEEINAVITISVPIPIRDTSYISSIDATFPVSTSDCDTTYEESTAIQMPPAFLTVLNIHSWHLPSLSNVLQRWFS